MTDAKKPLAEMTTGEIVDYLVCLARMSSLSYYACGVVGEAATRLERLSRLSNEGGGVEAVARARWTHIGRGGAYVEIGRGRMQCAEPTADMENVVIYQNETDGLMWVRPVSEFQDGRFRPMARAALATLPGGAEMREAAAACAGAWKRADALRLAAGEMTAQEMRTAQAVAAGIERAILALPLPHEPAKQEDGK